jgi:hypothetical protein
MPAASSEPSIVRRILSRLTDAELREINPHLQSDYRIAWITVLFASRGYVQPDVAASYAVLGLHPGKVWDAILERRRAMLGPLYEKFWGAAWPPKKPVLSATLADAKREGRVA